MSPLVYKRRAHKKVQPSAMEGLLSWSKAIVQAPVAGSIAFAFIVFAAASVGSMTLVAQAEISGGEYSAPQIAMHRHAVSAGETAVLGDHTDMPSMPMYQMGNASTAPQTINFSVTAAPNKNSTSTKDVGYTVQYNLAGISTLSIAVNGKVQGKNLPSSGSADIKVHPGMNEVMFGAKMGSKTQKLLTFSIFVLPNIDKMKQHGEGQNADGEHMSGNCHGDHCPQNMTGTPRSPLPKPGKGNRPPEQHGQQDSGDGNPPMMFQDHN